MNTKERKMETNTPHTLVIIIIPYLGMSDISNFDTTKVTDFLCYFEEIVMVAQ